MLNRIIIFGLLIIFYQLKFIQMAKIKLSAIVSEMRGKLNGSVFSRNRGGAYLRTKVTPLNPQTLAQTLVRSSFTAVSQAWKALTQAQRDSWNSSVNNFVGTDIFGDQKTPSGFNLFMRLNKNLNDVGATNLTVPPVPAPVQAFTSLTLSADTGGGTLDVVASDAVALVTRVKVFATAGVSPGKSFVKSEYRQIAALGAGDPAIQEFAAEYIAVFGSLPSVGLKVFLRYTAVLEASGQTGATIAAESVAF